MKRKVNTSRAGEEFTSLKRVRLAAGACSAALVFSTVVPATNNAPRASAEVGASPTSLCGEDSGNVNELRRSSTVSDVFQTFSGWDDAEKTSANFRSVHKITFNSYDLYGGRYLVDVDPRVAEYVTGVTYDGYGGKKTATKYDGMDNRWGLPLMSAEQDEAGNGGLYSGFWLGISSYTDAHIQFDRPWDKVVEDAGITDEKPAEFNFFGRFKPKDGQTPETADIVSNMRSTASIGPESGEEKKLDGYLDIARLNATSSGQDSKPLQAYDPLSKTVTLEALFQVKRARQYDMMNPEKDGEPYQIVIKMDPVLAEHLVGASVGKLRYGGFFDGNVDVPVDATTLNKETGELTVNVYGIKANEGVGIVNPGADEIFTRDTPGGAIFKTQLSLRFDEDIQGMQPSLQNGTELDPGFRFGWEHRSYQEGTVGTVVHNSSATTVLSLADSDNDGLTDEYERVLGTDPCVADTDGDGKLDGEEVNETKTDPLIAPPKLHGFDTAPKSITQEHVEFNEQTKKNLRERVIVLQKKNDDGSWSDVKETTVKESPNFELNRLNLQPGDTIRLAVKTVDADAIQPTKDDPDGGQPAVSAYENPEYSNEVTIAASDAERYTVAYPEKPTEATRGAEATAAPTVTDEAGSEAPAGVVSKYELGELPESLTSAGVTADDVSVDEATGVVTFTPKNGLKGGDYTIPVKVTYADGTSEDTEGATFTVAEKEPVKAPEDKVKVKDPKNLTDEEKEAVKKAVVDANPGDEDTPALDPDKVTVDNEGNVTVEGDPNYEDTTIPGTSLVEKDGSGEVDKKPVKAPEDKVKVKDPKNLTDEEKEAVKKAVVDANKDLNPDNVTVDNEGNVTVEGDPNYEDTTIPGTNLVEKDSDQAGSAPGMIAAWVGGSSGNGNAQGGNNQGGSSAIFGGSSNSTPDDSNSSGSSNGSSGSSVNQTSSGSSNGSSIGGILAAIVGLGLLATGIGFVAQWFMHAPALPGLPALKLPQIHLFGWGDRDDRDENNDAR